MSKFCFFAMYLRLLLNFIIYFFSQNSCKLSFGRLKYIRNILPKRGVVPMSCLRCSALELSPWFLFIISGVFILTAVIWFITYVYSCVHPSAHPSKLARVEDTFYFFRIFYVFLISGTLSADADRRSLTDLAKIRVFCWDFSIKKH